MVELYDLMTEIEAKRQAIRALFPKWTEDPSEDCAKQQAKLKKERGALIEKFEQKVEETSKALQGKEIPTIIEEEAPLKVVKPFRITELMGSDSPSLKMDCECTVELTAESTASERYQLGRFMLMDVKGEDESNKVVLSGFGSVMIDVSIVGGASPKPKEVYPVGTTFIVRVNLSAGTNSEGVSKGLYQLHHLTICSNT